MSVNELWLLFRYPCLALFVLSLFSAVLVLSAVFNNRPHYDRTDDHNEAMDRINLARDGSAAQLDATRNLVDISRKRRKDDKTR